MCLTSEVVITPPASYGGLDGTADPNSLGVSLYVHVYTRKDMGGGGCVGGEKCVRLRRRMPLVYSGEARAVVGRFVADPASSHYVFELRVSWHLCVCVF